MKPGIDYPGIGVFALILDKKNEVLLINHKATEKRDKEYEAWWSMPGGTVEFGETVETALKREIKEEMGLSISDIQLLNYNDYLKEGKHWLSVNMMARTKSANVKLNEPDKIAECRWFPLDQPPENLSPYAKECWEIARQRLNPPQLKPGIDYIGAGCGAFIVNDNGETLLMLRTPECKNDAGKWNKPGGTLEYGETAEQAIRREVKEELGIDIEIMHMLKHTDHIMPEQNQHWVGFNFVARVAEGQEPVNMEPHKHAELRWFRMDQLPENITQTVREPIVEYLEIIKNDMMGEG